MNLSNSRGTPHLYPHLCVLKLLQLCLTLCDPMDCSLPDSSVYEDSPRKNTGVGCYFLLEGIFLAQGLNPCLVSPALIGGFFTASATWKDHLKPYSMCFQLLLNIRI